jgi:hypothetical protein
MALNSDIIAENIPLRLTVEQMQEPAETLRGLFINFTLNKMREVLWDVFSERVAVNDDELGSYSRYDLLHYYEQMVLVLEAASMIYRIPGKGQKN